MPVSSIDCQGALALQAQGGLILDVREGWELQIAAVSGARHIPMGQIHASLDALPKDTAIACLCHHGARSMNVAQFLSQQGFESVYNITGGIAAWARDVDPALATY